MSDNPFEFINSISYKKNNLLKEQYSEKDYPSFLVNKGLSLYADTILYANEINRRPWIDNKLAYDFYLNSIRPRKRYSKWFKKTKDEDLELLKEYYKCSESKALEYLNVLSETQLEKLRERLIKGKKQ
jgi:hypothetical protein